MMGMGSKPARRANILLATALAMTMLVPDVALARPTLRIHTNAGVGAAKLGQTRSGAVKRLKRSVRLAKSGRDTRYVGRVVYYYYFGKKLSSGKYQLEVYAKRVRGSYRIFAFQINSPGVGRSGCSTAKGVHVGSTETRLRRAYGWKLKRYQAGAGWVRYSLGRKKGTDFWVRGGKIRKILVRQW